MTRYPSERSASHTCEPMKPAAPVTTMVCILQSFFLSAYAKVGKALFFHIPALINVAKIKKVGSRHGAFHLFEIQAAKLIPFRDQHHRMGSLPRNRTPSWGISDGKVGKRKSAAFSIAAGS